MGLALTVKQGEKVVLSCQCGCEIVITRADSGRRDKIKIDAPASVSVNRKKMRLIEERES